MAIRILLDLSVGDNVDEAFALALACVSPEVELIGVSTPYERTDALVRLTRRLLHIYGRGNVPVAGRDRHVLRDGEYTRVVRHHAQRIDGPLAPLVPDDVVDFMARTVTSHHSITVVATSPLTNVAELLQRYPGVERHLDAVVFMGGWMSQALPEWNMMADPEAVSTILRTKIPLKIIGYEVTLGCVLKQPHLRQFEGLPSPGARLLQVLCRCWSRLHGAVILHDPLTLTLLCRPQLVQLRRVRVSVNTRPGPGYGAIFADPGGRCVDLAVQVDVAAYLDFVLTRLLFDGKRSLIAEDPAKWAVRLWAAHRVNYYRGWSLPETTSDRHTVLLVTSGTCRARVAGSELTVPTGGVLYVPTHCPYAMQAEHDLELIWLQFDILAQRSWGSFVPLDRLPELPFCLLPADKAPLIFGYAERIVEEWCNPKWESTLFSQAYLMELMGHLFSLVDKGRGARGRGLAAALHQAKRYIESHIEEAIDLDSLSRYCSLSKFHLVRMFREAFGLTPMQYHTYLRIDRAKRLLSAQHLGIKEVAARVGYNSVSAFSRAFLRVVGVTPSEYRRAVLNGWPVTSRSFQSS